MTGKTTVVVCVMIVLIGLSLAAVTSRGFAEENASMEQPPGIGEQEWERLHDRVRLLKDSKALVERANFFDVTFTAQDLEEYIFPLSSALIPYLDGYWPEGWGSWDRTYFAIQRSTGWWLVAKANDRDLTGDDLAVAAEIADSIQEYLEGLDD